jgi:hypothetical protein
MNPEQFAKHCELQALWWIAYATSGACKSRQMFHGLSDGEPFTDKEKVAEALSVAQNHIRLFREVSEKGTF